MAQKRAARRGRKAPSPGSTGSVELGRNGEHRPAKKPSPEGSQSDHVREGSESPASRGLAAARDGPPRATKPATAQSTTSSGKEMSSKYSASRRQEEMANDPHSSEEEEEEEEEESEEEEWTYAPDPNPPHKRKRASGRVTRSQQRQVPEPAQQRGKEVAQHSESTKRKTKKTTPAPLQQQLSQPAKPKSKKTTPAPQGGDRAQQPSEPGMPKSKRIRRIWTPRDEVRILKALVRYRKKQGTLPAPDNNDFFHSIAKRLQDKKCNISVIKDKVRSLKRRYKSHVAPDTDHEQRLHHLSTTVWGDMPETHASNSNSGDGEQDEGEHAMPEADNGGDQTVDKSGFEEMCEMYPLLGQEVKQLAGVPPALRSSFTGLDGTRALLMEKKLEKLKWKELKIQAEMDAIEAPKARIRKELVNALSQVAKNL